MNFVDQVYAFEESNKIFWKIGKNNFANYKASLKSIVTNYNEYVTMSCEVRVHSTTFLY